MRHRILERAAAAGVALSLVVAAAAFADTVSVDADSLTAGIQGSRDLGTVAPGATVEAEITFQLGCANLQHVDRGQSVEVTIESATVPGGGAVAMDAVVLGPVPQSWPADGDGCSGAEAPIVGTGTLTVTAPAALGTHEIPILFSRALSPVGSNDGSAFGRPSATTLILTVAEAVNVPPTLLLPGDLAVTADGPDGWTANYVVSATDVEDDPDPTPTCAPAVGAVLPLGQTTVECSVTDAGGLTATGSFVVTVSAPEPPPEATPAVPPTAVFLAPVKVDGLDGRAGRTIPLKVGLMAGDESVGEGSLVLAVTPCAGGEAVSQLEMAWRAASDRWFGLLRTQGLEAGCYDVRAIHDGVDVGGIELRLFDNRAAAAKEKAAAAKEKAQVAREKAATAKEKATSAKAGARSAGQGASRKSGG
jgi:hypothetical protein